MIDGKNILFIGCSCRNPKGGVAAVLETYRKEIFGHFKFVRTTSDKGFLAKIAVLLYSLIKSEIIERTDKNVDLVHIHSSAYNDFKRSSIFIRQAKRNGKKVVIHIHDGRFREFYNANKDFVDSQLSICDTIVVLSEYWLNFFAKELHFPCVRIVNNVIPRPQLLNNTKEDNLFHILYMGGITEEKGVFDLLNAISVKKYSWEGKIMFHICGKGDIDKMLAQIDSLGLNKLVIYEGWANKQKKVEMFNASDAFILPSYKEGMPISILESLSYGVPVLATPVGGIPDIIRNRENGMLFKPGCTEDLCEVVNSVVTDAQLRDYLVYNGKQTASAFFVDRIEKQLLIVYQSCV